MINHKIPLILIKLLFNNFLYIPSVSLDSTRFISSISALVTAFSGYIIKPGRSLTSNGLHFSDASLAVSLNDFNFSVCILHSLKSTTSYDYKTAFRINSSSGLITVNRVLDYQVAAVVILTVQVQDLNAITDKEKQITKVEVTIYIQAYSDDNPTFTNPGWSPNNPTIRISVPEEQPLGTTLLMLSAKEPTTGYAVQRFELVREDDDEGYVNVGVQSGNVVLSKRLDYEALNQKVNFHFKVPLRFYEP